ncbi:MAG: helix-turn-helix transcriptional regulator, partial [Clostridiales bacterium]|nr:helix-turn-helix transcriptional regulator [Clostridiales bacterium]
ISPETEEDEETFEQEKFAEIAEYLEQNLCEPITLDMLTKQFAINRNKLNAIFEKQASMTCLNYLLKLRMDLAMILLSKTELPVGEIGTRVGFPDPNYFTKVFKSKTGKTPSKYRYP